MSSNPYVNLCESSKKTKKRSRRRRRRKRSSGYSSSTRRSNDSAQQMKETEILPWKLKVPGKVKHFLWTACTNSLPTKANLLKRIITDSNCHLCGRVSEDVKHALWDCEAVKVVWGKDFSWFNRFEAENGSFLDLMDRLITKKGAAELFATTAWFLWTHRNKCRLLEKTTPLGSISEAAKQWLLQFRSRNGEQSCVKLPRNRKWQLPEPGEFKANFDRVMFNKCDEAGVGVVVRDAMGEIIAALAEKIRKPHSVECSEMIADRRAVVFASEFGLQHCQFEGDSETVIKALNSGEIFSSSFGHFIRYTLFYVNSMRSSLSLTWLGKLMLLHVPLIQKAKISFPLLAWLEDIPYDTEVFVSEDYLAY